MKRRKVYEINYWPSFSDLLISVVLMLILYLFIQEITFYLSDAYRQQRMKQKQTEYKNKIKTALGPDSVAISSIKENGVNQTISFKSSFLFATGKATFKNENSKELVRAIAPVLKEAIENSDVEQIVIEGHTNSIPYMNQYGNWSLASKRAVTVIKMLLSMGITKNVDHVPKRPTRVLSIAGFADRDFVMTQDGEEDMEESKRIQFSLVYALK